MVFSWLNSLRRGVVRGYKRRKLTQPRRRLNGLFSSITVSPLVPIVESLEARQMLSAVSTQLAVSASSLTYGAVDNLSATCKHGSLTVTTGYVDFFDNGVLIGAAQITGGTASLAVNLHVGTGSQAITAEYDDALSGTTFGANLSLTKTVTVHAAPLTVTPTSGQTEVYGQNIAPTFTATGFVNGDSYGQLIGNLTTASKNAGTTTITKGTLADSDYTFSVSNVSLTITPDHITGSFTAQNKVYDATTGATIVTETANSIAGDDVSLTGGTATFGDKNVGTNKTVTLTGAGLSGVDAANYVLDSVGTATANITADHITGSFTAQNKVYDATTGATIVTETANSIAGDDVSLTGGTATFGDKNVGTNKTVTLTGAGLSGVDAANYVLDSVGTATANITADHITGSFTAQNKVYDATTGATIVTETANSIAGDDVSLTGGTATFGDKNVGTNKTVTLTGAGLSGVDAANYVLDSVATATANITADHITGSFTAQNKVYDATTGATIVTETANSIAGDDVSLTGGTATFGDKNVGTNKTVTLTGAGLSGVDAANYVLDSVGTATANITADHITGSFTAQNKVYDATTGATIVTETANNSIAGDTVTLTGGTATFDNKNVGTNKTVTLTGAGLSGVDAANYVLDSVGTATANITADHITGSFTAQNKVYDAATGATIVTETANSIAGDDVSLTGGTATFGDKNVGTNKTVTLTGAGLSGVDAANYVLDSVGTATANITADHITGSFTAQNKVYDATTGATIVTETANSIAGDDVSLTGGTATFGDKNVGTNKTVTLTGAGLSGVDAANYVLDSVGTATANITADHITGSFTAQNKVYDATTGATIVTETANNSIAGDTVTLTGGTATFDNKNVGTNKTVTLTGAGLSGVDAANYVLDSVGTATANITADHITGSFTAQNKVYDATTGATIVTETANSIAGDDVSLTGGTATFGDKNVGTNKTVTLTGAGLSGVDAANYVLDSVATATANITADHITGSFTAQNKVYDATTGATIVTETANSIAGDDVSLTGGTATFGDKNVGTNKTVTLTGAGLSGVDAANYVLDSVGTATANITADHITGSFTAQNKVYDATTGATIVTETANSIAGDDVSLTGGTATFGDKNVGTNKTVTLTGAGLSGVDAANYVLDSVATATANITADHITGSFTAQNKVYDATTGATIVTETANSIAGDDVSLTGGTATFGDKNVGTNKTVTLTGAGLSGVDAANYVLDSVGTATANITADHITGSFTAQNKVYDATTGATIVTETANNSIAGDTVTLTGGTATFDNKNVGTNKTVTLTGAGLSGVDAANYVLDSVGTATANITADHITGSFTAQNKVYDAATGATIVTETANSIAGDDVSLTGGTATFGDKNVGTNKTVTLTGAGLSGVDAANYVLDSVGTATANITADHITGSFTAQNKVYDATTGATIVTETANSIAGDDVSLTGGTATFGDKNVGTNKTVTLTGAGLSGVDAANYVLDSVATATANITADHITGSFTAQNKVYDATTGATIVTETANSIAGDDVSLTGGTATFGDKNVGTNKTVTLTGAGLSGVDAANYVLDSVGTATANITADHITGSFTAQNKVYDATTGATIVTETANNSIAGDTVTLTGGTATFDNKNVGTNKTVTLTGAGLSGVDAANYVLDSVGTATANITADHITGSFTAQNKVYDAATGATIVTETANSIAGDDVSLTGGTATFGDKNVGTNKTVTLTGAGLSGVDAANYVLDSVGTATANITADHITGSFTAQNKVYDATTGATIVTETANSIAGDDVSLTGGTATFGDKNVGTNKTVTLTGAGLSGVDAANYVLDSVGTATANITADHITGSFTAQNKVYDATTGATIVTETANNSIAGDTVTLTGGTATFDNKNVGTNKTVTLTGAGLSGVDAANYVLDSVGTATANITADHITGSFTAQNKVYDAATGATIVTETANSIAGDDVSLTGGTATFGDKNVGTNKTVTLTGAGLSGVDAANYVLDSVGTATANITADHITGSFTAQNKVYDATTGAAIVTETANSIAGDDVSLTGGTATFGDKNVGTNKTVTLTGAGLSGVDAANYVLDSVATATANITADHITGSFTAQNKVYDATTGATIVTETANSIAGDDVSLTGGTATFGDKNVGTNKTVTLTGAGLSGVDAANYVLDSVATATANITADHITGNFTAQNKVYDATTGATIGTETLNNVISGDVVTLTGGTATFDNKNVGTGKTVTLTGAALSGVDAANYVLDSVGTATANVTPASVSYTVQDQNQIFGTAATLQNPTIQGVNGENLTIVEYSSGDSATAHVGNYSITGMVADGTGANAGLASDYNVTVTPGNLAVTVSGPEISEQNQNSVTFTVNLLSNSEIPADNSLSVSNLLRTGGDASGISISADHTTLTIDPSAYAYLAAGEKAVITYSYTVVGTGGLNVNTTATITIDGLNDAPVFNDTSILHMNNITANEVHVLGTSVASLALPRIDDVDDNPVAGIVIVGQSTPSSLGTWQYSTDSGSTWNSITGASLSNGLHLIANATDQVRFVPNGSQIGNSSLFALAWDTTNLGTVVGSTTISDGVYAPVNSTGATTAYSQYTGASSELRILQSVLPASSVPPIVLNPIADRSAQEGSLFNFTVPSNTFLEQDSEALTYRASVGGSALPAWLTFNRTTQQFSGTPGVADVGVIGITVTATNASSQSVTSTFFLTINDAPLTAGTVTAGGGAAATTVTTLSATFTDGNTLGSASNFSGTINWGDGNSTIFTSSAVSGSSGNYSVAGSHLYATAGSFNISVTVNDVAGESTTINGSTSVGKVNTSTTVTAHASGAYTGSAYVATGSVSGPGAPTGAVTLDYFDNTTHTDLLGAAPKDVGSYTVTATYAGDSNNNGSSASANFSITPAVVNYTIGNDSQTEGTAADLGHDLGTTINGVNGETLSITYISTGDTASADEGTSPITATLGNGSGLLSNYTVNLTSGVLTINDAALTAGTITAGGGVASTTVTTLSATFTDSNTSGSASDFSGTINWGDGNSSSFTSSAISGSYAVAGSHQYVTAGNFNITVMVNDDGGQSTTISGSTSVAKGNTVTTVTAPTSGAYTGHAFVATGSVSGPAAPTGTVTLDYFDNTTHTDLLGAAPKDVGSYTVRATYAGDSNNNSSSASADFSITPAVVNYTIGNDSQTEGTAADLGHDLGTTINGVNGETLSITYISTGDTASADEGTSPITATLGNGSGLLSNYTVNLTSGVLTINDAALTAGTITAGGGVASTTVTTLSATFTDGNTSGSTSDFSGTINWGDGNTALFDSSVVSGSSGIYSVAGSHQYATAGTFNITVTVNDVGGKLTTVSGTTSVAKGNTVTTVTAPTSSAYTGHAFVATGSVSGPAAPTGTVTLDYFDNTTHTDLLGAAPKDVGSYTVRATYAGDSNNNSSSASADFSITPAVVNYTIGNDSQTEGTAADLAHDLGTTINGVNGETLSITYISTGDSASADEGTSPITATLGNGSGLLSNYTVNLTSGVLTINDAALTASTVTAIGGVASTTVTTLSATFTDANTFGSVSDFSGTINWGDGNSATFDSSAVSGSSGSYSVAGSHQYVTAGNFNITVTVNDDGGQSTTVSGTTSVAKGNTVTTVTAHASGVYTGSAYSATGSVSGPAAPTGIVTLDYFDNTTHADLHSTAPKDVGSYTVTATYAGDANNNGSSASADFTITPATPTVTVQDASGAYTGHAFTATGSALGVDGVTQATGTFAYTYYVGVGTSGASSHTAPVNVGNYTVVATFTSGSQDYVSQSSSAVTFVIVPQLPLTGNVLYINETSGDDTMLISETAGVAGLVVTLDGVAFTYDSSIVKTVYIYGSAGNDTITVNSLLSGTAFTAICGSGNDQVTVDPHVTTAVYLIGGSGNDVLMGGSGNDTLQGASGNTTIIGGSGNDILIGGTGNNSITAGAGVDSYILTSRTSANLNKTDVVNATGTRNTLQFSGTNGVSFSLQLASGVNQTANTTTGYQLNLSNNTFQTVILPSGNNNVTGNSTLGTTLYGGTGNNTLTGGSGTDALIGGKGSNTLIGGSGNERLSGGIGSNFIQAGNGTDTLIDGLGSNTLVGGTGNDTFIISARTVQNANDKDVLTSAGGHNTLIFQGTNGLTFSLAVGGGSNNDQRANDYTGFQLNLQSNAFQTVNLGSGNNIVTGNSTLGTQIVGGTGSNVLIGGTGNDTLLGGSGRDILIGGMGTDYLNGGGGDNILIGGTLSFSGNLVGLTAIENEWNSADSYATRVSTLKAGVVGSDSQTYALSLSTISLGTSQDYMLGGARTGGVGPNDWFWATALDLTDIKSNEFEN